MCTANSFDGPKSSDRVSTASPATSRSWSRNSPASFEKPGKCNVLESSWPRKARASPALASQPEFRNTPHCLGSRPCAFSHRFRSSMVTRASASLRALSRRSITTDDFEERFRKPEEEYERLRKELADLARKRKP